jgi:RNA polymerase sigma-70 factor (ECF subfamily)
VLLAGNLHPFLEERDMSPLIHTMATAPVDWEQVDACYRRRATREAHALVGHVWPEPNDEAADIAVEAMGKAFTRLHQYDPRRPFWFWLRAIVRTTAIDRLRKFASALLGEQDALVADEATPEALLLAREDRGELDEALDRALRPLKPRDRDLFVRFYGDGEPVEALAQEAGVAVQTVRSILSRAKKVVLVGLGLPHVSNGRLKRLLSR